MIETVTLDIDCEIFAKFVIKSQLIRFSHFAMALIGATVDMKLIDRDIVCAMHRRVQRTQSVSAANIDKCND